MCVPAPHFPNNYNNVALENHCGSSASFVSFAHVLLSCSSTHTRRRRRRLGARKSCRVLMPEQVKLKLPRARVGRNTFHVNEQQQQQQKQCSSPATATIGAVMREQHRIYIYGVYCGIWHRFQLKPIIKVTLMTHTHTPSTFSPFPLITSGWIFGRGGSSHTPLAERTFSSSSILDFMDIARDRTGRLLVYGIFWYTICGTYCTVISCSGVARSWSPGGSNWRKKNLYHIQVIIYIFW